VRPITDTKTRDYRTKLLTRRVRAIMRAFNKNPNYLSVTPNITWDDSFIPPELYDDLETELASLDAKESQRVQKEKEREKEKAKESQKRKMEEQMAKEKAKAKQNDKGKAKETAQDEDDTEKPKRKWTRKSSESSLFDVIRDNGIPADETEPPEATQDDKAKAKETAQDKEIPDDTENLKRKWTRKTSESSITGGNEDGTPADEAEPPAKRIKSKKTVDDIAVPPPCRQCTMSEIECEPNGWCAACKSCRRKKQTCSLSKARCRPTNSKVIEPDDRSSIDSEDEDVVDVVMVNLSATTINGFISDDPKVCL
jgi:hypothetical protein